MDRNFYVSYSKVVRLLLMIVTGMAVSLYFVFDALFFQEWQELNNKKLFLLPILVIGGGYLIIDLLWRLFVKKPAVIIGAELAGYMIQKGTPVLWRDIVNIELIEIYDAYKEIHITLHSGTILKVKSRYFKMNVFDVIYKALMEKYSEFQGHNT